MHGGQSVSSSLLLEKTLSFYPRSTSRRHGRRPPKERRGATKMYKLLSFFPPPLTHRTKLIFRIVLTLALILGCVVARWMLPGSTLTFLLLGIGLSHIWITFGTVQTTTSVPPRQRGVDPPSGASPVPTATATATTTTTDYDKLTFTKAEGTVLVGRNSYILNHPLPLVSYAVFHKFPVLPCEEVPELISIQLMEETHPTHNCTQKKRLITSKNIVPAALGSAMGLADTSMVLECSEEIDGVTLEIVAQNEDALDFACLQVW